VGSGAALATWVTWTSPGDVTALFTRNVVGNFSVGLAQLLGPVPGSHTGLATGSGKAGVVLAAALLVIVVASSFAKTRRDLLALCACGLVAASIGLVVDAAVAVNNTIGSTRSIDREAHTSIAATAALPSLPVLGSISDDLAHQVHLVRQHVVTHSVRPAFFALGAGVVALIGSLMVLVGTVRRGSSSRIRPRLSRLAGRSDGDVS